MSVSVWEVHKVHHCLACYHSQDLTAKVQLIEQRGKFVPFLTENFELLHHCVHPLLPHATPQARVRDSPLLCHLQLHLLVLLVCNQVRLSLYCKLSTPCSNVSLFRVRFLTERKSAISIKLLLNALCPRSRSKGTMFRIIETEGGHRDIFQQDAIPCKQLRVQVCQFAQRICCKALHSLLVQVCMTHISDPFRAKHLQSSQPLLHRRLVDGLPLQL
mmetsp:Transcript_5010/g.11107  ORF Transcript_5010/g.11107 Transcript_5010/m.11107 type:complete len:216 (+) Transcript_5010:2508-3155(+)